MAEKLLLFLSHARSARAKDAGFSGLISSRSVTAERREAPQKLP
jgi:hypothetical protein